MDAEVAGVGAVPAPLTGYHIVTAVMRDGDRVLMVHERAPDGSAGWTLPGGVVEAGELLTEALAREVREETGLEVLDPGRLLYVVCAGDASTHHHTVIFAFDVAAWRGDLRAADPDGFVLGAQFQPVAHMAEELTRLGPVRSRPILAFLRSEIGPGALWLYWRDQDGIEQMTACPPLTAPSSAPPPR